jgi:hypothetical protein
MLPRALPWVYERTGYRGITPPHNPTQSPQTPLQTKPQARNLRQAGNFPYLKKKKIPEIHPKNPATSPTTHPLKKSKKKPKKKFGSPKNILYFCCRHQIEV